MKKIIFIILIAFFSCKSENDTLLEKYKNKALHDIKVDSIKIFNAGLPLPPRDSLEFLKNNQKDNIYKSYGLFRKSLGCTVGDKELDIAVREYYKITDVYLEDRNGKGWNERMKKELNRIDGN